MSNILLLNGAQPYEFAPGTLNATLVDRARTALEAQGHAVRVTTVAEGYDANFEVESHVWADTVIMQFPVNWMGVPWSFKKYMDEVYTAGMDGRLCAGDGRTARTGRCLPASAGKWEFGTRRRTASRRSRGRTAPRIPGVVGPPWGACP